MLFLLVNSRIWWFFIKICSFLHICWTVGKLQKCCFFWLFFSKFEH